MIPVCAEIVPDLPPGEEPYIPYDEAKGILLNLIRQDKLFMDITFERYPVPLSWKEFQDMMRAANVGFTSALLPPIRKAIPGDIPRIIKYYDVKKLQREGAAM